MTATSPRLPGSPREAHDLAVSQQGHYTGAVTRLAAFVVDHTVAGLVFSGSIAVLGFVIGYFTGTDVDVRDQRLLVGIAYVAWLFAYFAYSWAASGRTAGMALLGIRVVHHSGAPLSAGRAALRTAALPLGFLTLGVGFAGIVVGRRRRAIHDVIAGTAVVYDWDARAARLRFLARD